MTLESSHSADSTFLCIASAFIYVQLRVLSTPPVALVAPYYRDASAYLLTSSPWLTAELLVSKISPYLVTESRLLPGSHPCRTDPSNTVHNGFNAEDPRTQFSALRDVAVYARFNRESMKWSGAFLPGSLYANRAEEPRNHSGTVTPPAAHRPAPRPTSSRQTEAAAAASTSALTPPHIRVDVSCRPDPIRVAMAATASHMDQEQVDDSGDGGNDGHEGETITTRTTIP
ncbi:hypothetical protein DL768_001153 [Monosporascus sp. mg162]|nr:hypothetical protein DL768_001153 [Monosporascus sp. mg162]